MAPDFQNWHLKMAPGDFSGYYFLGARAAPVDKFKSNYMYQTTKATEATISFIVRYNSTNVQFFTMFNYLMKLLRSFSIYLPAEEVRQKFPIFLVIWFSTRVREIEDNSIKSDILQ